MKNRNASKPIFLLAVLIQALAFIACTTGREPGRGLQGLGESDSTQVLHTSFSGSGMPIEVEFRKGRAHNHPLMAIWIEDTNGTYLQTLYVAESIGKGVFRHGDASSGRWMPGPIRRPAALPYWGHQRGKQAADGLYLPTQADPVPDGISGPTPKSHFLVRSGVPAPEPAVFRVLVEVNQSWDWNAYWTNNKFPGDKSYMSSSQPAVVYEAVINPGSGQREYPMRPIGHSHWSGKTGELFRDLGTLTTALDIAEEITVRIP